MYSKAILFLSIGTLIFTVVNSIRGDRMQGVLKRWEPVMEGELDVIFDKQRISEGNEEYLDEMWEKMEKKVGLRALLRLLGEKKSCTGEIPLDQRVWKNDREYLYGMWEILKGEVGIRHLESYMWSKINII